MREAHSKARRAPEGQISNLRRRLGIDLVFSRRDEPSRQQGRDKQGDGRSGQLAAIAISAVIANSAMTGR